jgi:putative acyl-CoA dehydrogenase
MCLDVLRAFTKTPATRDMLLEELSAVLGRHRQFDSAFARFADALESPAVAEEHARRFTQSLVTLMQARLLLGGEPSSNACAVAEGFCATRLNAASGWGAVFGASDAAVNVGAILDRAWAG